MARRPHARASCGCRRATHHIAASAAASAPRINAALAVQLRDRRAGPPTVLAAYSSHAAAALPVMMRQRASQDTKIGSRLHHSNSRPPHACVCVLREFARECVTVSSCVCMCTHQVGNQCASHAWWPPGRQRARARARLPAARTCAPRCGCRPARPLRRRSGPSPPARGRGSRQSRRQMESRSGWTACTCVARKHVRQSRVQVGTHIHETDALHERGTSTRMCASMQA